MLPTKKTEQRISLDGLILYLYGPPKVGKTTFVANLETKGGKVLFLDCEGGTLRIEDECFDVQIRTWLEFEEAVKALHKDPDHGFTIICVDSMTELRDQLVRHMCDLKGAKDPSDPKFGGRQGWGKVSAAWKNALNLLMAGQWASVFLDHATQVTVDQNGNRVADPDKYKGPTRVIQEPTLSASARFIIAKRSDIMLRAFKDQQGNRVATTAELDGMGGQRGGILPDSFQLDGKQFVSFFRDAYMKRKKERAQGSEA